MVYLFSISIILIIYTFIGYPIIVYWLSLKLKNNLQTDSLNSVKHYDLTILMIVCNEEKQVEKKLTNLLNLSYFNEQPKIVIVDDNSDDSTVEIINKVSSNRIDLIMAPHRLGKANGINVAMEVITTPLVLLVDVRQEVDIDAAEKLSKWFEMDQNVGAISGELCFKSTSENDFSKGMDGYWRYEKFIRKSEAAFNSVPGVTGALYMLRREAFEEIPTDTILDDVLIPMVAIQKGYKIGFDDQAKAWDIPSNDPVNERRRKIRTINGNFQLLFRNPKWLLPTGNPIWWQYISHKILRLFIPYIALLSLLLSIRMANDSNMFALIYSVGFIVALLLYPINVFVPLLGKNKYLRLWLSFLTLNWFNVLGFYDYLFSARKQSWK